MMLMSRGEARESSAIMKFRLLMWKNFLQQWRHPLQTLVEVLLPVGAMGLILIMRSQVNPKVENLKKYPPIPASTLHYSLKILECMNISQLSIAYSPESPVLEDVLKKATSKLISMNKGDKNLIDMIQKRYPDFQGSIENFVNIKVHGYKNRASLRTIYSSEEVTRRIIAGVQFDDKLYGATKLPDDVKFYLRFPERPRGYSFYSEGTYTWRTDRTFPNVELTGPRKPDAWEGGKAPGYVIEMFIAFQHLISMELIEKLTALDLHNFEVAINRYPHPPYIEDYAMEALHFLLPMLIMVSYSYSAMNTVRAITLEKELQLKETMKIMGLPTWLHWTAWFCKQYIFFLIISVLIVILIKVHWFKTGAGFSNYAVFTYTSWTVLLFFFLMYSACAILFCFMLSGFFSKASTAASFSGVIWFLTYLPATVLMMNVKVSTAMQTILCLSINTAMAFGFHVLVVEESVHGLQWDHFWKMRDLDSNTFVFGIVIVMMAIDSVLYLLIALYLDQVLPGPHAAPKPWNFIFHKSFWVHEKIKADDIVIDPKDTPDVVMEKVPGNPKIGVKLTNLTKYYGQTLAVDNLCLDVYEDQITVLMGHNGAGKSTAISMLAGNTEISSGSVWVAGYDMTRQTQAARVHLGFCSQYNVLFNELTVGEHLEFFGRLKGLTGVELREDIETLITKLGLHDKRDYLSAGLSGGQKRRLQVGIALSGGPRVVLLDEPISGMDPASRRALCDLLQLEKPGRAIIIATHFMDEADLIGDRVAILSGGRLQCVGSPFFLKRQYGIGYTLVIVKKDGFQLDTCTEIIKRHIPGVAAPTDRGTEIAYAIKNDYSRLFEEMLNELDAHIDTINYKHYGLRATTLEDVFMSVGSDLPPSIPEFYNKDTPTTSNNQAVDTYTGTTAADHQPLWKQHILAVWLKLFLVWSRSWRLLLTQGLVSFVMVSIILGILQWVRMIKHPSEPRELTLTRGFLETETLLSYSGLTSSSQGAVTMAAYKQMLKSTKTTITVVKQDMNDYYLKRSALPFEMGYLRRRILIGATFYASSGIAWFSNFGYHDVAISLNSIHQALLKTWNPNATLSVFNYPLQVRYADQFEGDMQIYAKNVSLQLAAGIGASLSIVSSIFVMFYIKERIIRAKLLQKAAGIQPVIMWGGAAVFDWTWFLVICLTIIIALIAFDVVGLSTVAELGRMYLVLMVYGATMLPLNYVMSLLFSGPVMGFVAMFFINIVFGQIGSQIVMALFSPKLNTQDVAETLDHLLQFFPLYDLIRSVTHMVHIGLTQWTCLKKCKHLSSVTSIGQCSMKTMCKNNYTVCCVPDNPYFEWKKPGILRYITCSLSSCVFLWTVLLSIEYQVYDKLFSRFNTPPVLDESTMDSDVVEEIRRVEKIETADLPQHKVVAKTLSKYYGDHLAVDQVSFVMSEAEVFGLLGVNGAGKTTTFKMLMGDEPVSSGDAFICGRSVTNDIHSVHKDIGYCPQFDAVFSELTGRETLRLFSMLRGLPSQFASKRTDLLADVLGFTEQLDKRVAHYSGGTKRKLSTAIALLGSMRLIFVDEPTAGVDPAAKRRVWCAILDARRAGRGVVLTSHCMEECEALCSRLTIMVNGKFQCLGTPQHLKNKFFQGFVLRIKMKIGEGSTMWIADVHGTDGVKQYVEQHFNNAKLLDERQGLITYYLPDRSMAWSRMFGIMERCRELHLVDDYILSQTTLEQIFLQVTKYQTASFRNEDS